MPRKPPPERRPANSRLQTYISGHVHEQVALYCAQRNWHESTFFETASVQLLEGTGDKQVLLRRLDRLDRRVQRIDETLRASLVLLHEFVEVWFERAHRSTGDTKRAHQAFMDKVTSRVRTKEASGSVRRRPSDGETAATPSEDLEP